MKEKTIWLPGVLLLVFTAAVFGVATCDSGDGGELCPDQSRPYRCPDGQCYECCSHVDCGVGQICTEDRECVSEEGQEGDDCSGDPGICHEGLCCDIFTGTCLAGCSVDADCAALHPDVEFNDDLECREPCCDFAHCNKDDDCTPGTVCFDSDCVTRPDCDDVDFCKLTPHSAFTQEGTTARFGASAYMHSGALAPGMGFSWTSDAPGVASVGPEGLVTGGGETGNAIITASVEGCSISCAATVTNFAAVGSGTRVVVVDSLAGSFVEGASVVVGGEGPVFTDANGVAEFTAELSGANPLDVTVSKLDYNYVTLRSVESNDVIVDTGRLHHLDFEHYPPTQVAGGIRGSFDYNLIPCEEGHGCEVSVGLAGFSAPGNLVNLNFDLLIGGGIKTLVELGDISDEVAMPAGISFCLNETCFKEFYSPTGVPGTRVAWGLGGKLDLNVLVDKLAPIISGGEDVDVPALIVDLLPLFSGFRSAMVPNVDVVPIDKVEDVDDIDDDETTTHVPDYADFPEVDMTLKVAMDEEMILTPPLLPVGTYDGVLVVAGVLVRGAGLVPLGIGVGLDSTGQDDPPDGRIDDPIVVKVSSVAGRIPEDRIQRVVVAVAMNIESLARGEGQPLMVAGQVKLVSEFEGIHGLGGFLTPAQGTYDPATRRLEVTEVPAGIDYAQVIFAGDRDVNWHVLGEWTAGDYYLPAPPPAGDRSARAYFVGIKLNDRFGDITFQDLPAFNDTNMSDLVDLVESFCYTDVPAP